MNKLEVEKKRENILDKLVEFEWSFDKLLTLASSIDNIVSTEDGSLYIKYKNNLVISSDGSNIIHSKNGDIVIKSNFLHLNPESYEMKNIQKLQGNNTDKVIKELHLLEEKRKNGKKGV